MINDQEFVTYEIEIEPVPGRMMQERRTLTVKSGNVFGIKLTARASNFDEHLPDYELLLKSLKLA